MPRDVVAWVTEAVTAAAGASPAGEPADGASPAGALVCEVVRLVGPGKVAQVWAEAELAPGEEPPLRVRPTAEGERYLEQVTRELAALARDGDGAASGRRLLAILPGTRWRDGAVARRMYAGLRAVGVQVPDERQTRQRAMQLLAENPARAAVMLVPEDQLANCLEAALAVEAARAGQAAGPGVFDQVVLAAWPLESPARVAPEEGVAGPRGAVSGDGLAELDGDEDRAEEAWESEEDGDGPEDGTEPQTVRRRGRTARAVEEGRLSQIGAALAPYRWVAERLTDAPLLSLDPRPVEELGAGVELELQPLRIPGWLAKDAAEQFRAAAPRLQTGEPAVLADESLWDAYARSLYGFEALRDWQRDRLRALAQPKPVVTIEQPTGGGQVGGLPARGAVAGGGDRATDGGHLAAPGADAGPVREAVGGRPVRERGAALGRSG